MMTRLLFFLFLLFFIMGCTSQEGKIHDGCLLLSSTVAGDSVSFQYDLNKSSISGESNVGVILYYTVAQNIYAVDLPIRDSGQLIQSTFFLPDSAAAFALKFQGKYTDRNKGKGYIFQATRSSNEKKKGAWAGSALFFTKRQSLLRLPQNRDTALSLLQKEFEHFPREKEEWLKLYLNTLVQVSGEKAYPEVKENLAELLADEPVKKGQYHLAYKVYRKMNMTDLADSVEKVGLQKFPNGKLAEYMALRKFNRQKNLDSLLYYYEQYKKRFPAHGFQGFSSRMQNLMSSRIALDYSKKGDYRTFLKMVNQIKNPIDRASAYINVATSLAESKKKLRFADSILLISLPLMKESMNRPGEEKPTYISDKEWKKKIGLSYGLTTDTYAMVLFYQGKLREAVENQQKAVDIFQGHNSDVNTRYIQYLMAAGEYETAKKQLERFYFTRYKTQKMAEYLPKMYREVYGTDQGFSGYKDSLEHLSSASPKDYPSP